MSKQEFTPYQKSTISHYYEHIDTIMLQKISELITELYLADSEAKRNRLWDRVQKAMLKLKIPPAIRDHILDKRDMEVMAKNLQDWQGGKINR